MRLNVTYDKLDLSVDVNRVDDSFDHAFGTQKQSHYEINAIYYNGNMIPLSLISEDTLDYLETEVNK